jgi:hypothetical protein
MVAPIIGVLPHKSNTPIHLTPVSHVLLTDPFDYYHPLFSCVLLLWCKTWILQITFSIRH